MVSGVYLGPCLLRFRLDTKDNTNFSSLITPLSFFIFTVISSLDTHIFVTGVIHRESISGVSIKFDKTFKFQKNLSSQDCQDDNVFKFILFKVCKKDRI